MRPIRDRRRFDRSAVALAVSGALLATTGPARALPTGERVVAGTVSFQRAPGKLDVVQGSQRAIVNWNGFSIGAQDLVQLTQPGAHAAMLARVVGSDPSQLLGRLSANGQFFLINPNGILVGQGARIDTAAFLASTLDMADQDFLGGGGMSLRGDSRAAVVNLGTINAQSGNVMMVGHSVANHGTITAPRGTAALAAGSDVFLASPSAPSLLVRASLPGTAGATGVENSGLIAAAQAQLQAGGGGLYGLAVSQRGVVQANGFENRGGRILLTAEGGTVSVGGSLTARNADGSGGEILVGGDYLGGNPEVANAARTLVTASAKLDASAESVEGKAGRVIVWADDETRYHGAIEARGGAAGGDGGFVEVSGKRALSFTGTADVSAPAGTSGTVLLDPGFINIVAGNAAAPANATDGNWAAGEDAGAQTISVGAVTGLLGTGNLRLAASNNVTVDALVSSATTNRLELMAGTSVVLNAGLSLPNGNIDLLATSTGPGLSSGAGAVLEARNILTNFATVKLAGPVVAESLSYDLASAQSFSAANASNRIAGFTMVQPTSFSGDVDVRSSTAMAVSGQISTLSDLTLVTTGMGTNWRAATNARLTALGTTRVGATGSGAFVNEAGTALFGGNGRKLVYSYTDSGLFNDGGLGYRRFSGVTFPGDPTTLGTVTYLAKADQANFIGNAPLEVRMPKETHTTTYIGTFSVKSAEEILKEKNEADAKQKLVVGSGVPGAGWQSATRPLTPADFAPLVGEEGFRSALQTFLKGDGYKELTDDQRALLQSYASGKLSAGELSSRLQSDRNAQQALMPVFGQYISDLVAGKFAPTLADRVVLDRIANLVNEQRKAVAVEAERLYAVMVKARNDVSGVGFMGMFSSLMWTDVVKVAQQNVLEKTLATAGGVVAGGVAAGAMVKALGSQIFIHAAATAARAGIQVGAGAGAVGTAAAAGTAGVIASAILAVVLGSIKVAEIEQYEKSLAEVRSGKSAINNLSGFDLNQTQNSADLFAAVMRISTEAFR